MLKPELTTLASGLKVLRIPMPHVKSVTVCNMVRVGSRFEEPRIAGIAHFLEHMVFKGTEQFANAQVLAAAVDAVGADFNAFTSKEYTCYYVKADSRHIRLALNVISDMLLTPQLNPDDIDREKQVIIEEMNMYLDTPMRHIGDVFENMVFAGSGLGRPIIGTKESVMGVKRSDFEHFLQTWYGPEQCLVVIAGDDRVVGDKGLVAEVEEYFSKGSSKRAPAPQNKDHFWLPTMADQPRLDIEYKKTEQAHFIMGFPGLKRTDDRRFTLNLLATALGGNMSSRLFTKIRENRGLCYYVHSDVDYYHDLGVFGASAGVDPRRLDEALEATLHEFKILADASDMVTADELQKAQDYMAGKLVLGLEDSETVAQFFGVRQLLTGTMETPEVVLERYRAVTHQDIVDLAQQLIQLDQVRFAVIGPYQSDQENHFRDILQMEQ